MTADAVPPTVVALKSVTLVLGGLITYLAYRTYRKTEAEPIGALAAGFGLVTAGALLAGAAHQGFGLAAGSVLLVESTLTAAGFGIITYSLYADW